MDAVGAADESADKRTAKSCGPDAPTLASSRRKQFRRRRWQKSPVTGESTKETVKTIAQGMLGVSGEPVVTNSCVFLLFTREAMGASCAPGIPCALLFSRDVGLQNLGRYPPRDCGAATLMVRSASSRVSNHEARGPSFETRPSSRSSG
jgi:hypothetical protein